MLFVYPKHNVVGTQIIRKFWPDHKYGKDLKKMHVRSRNVMDSVKSLWLGHVKFWLGLFRLTKKPIVKPALS